MIKHLNGCGFLPVSCPLRCVESEGDIKGKVVRMERRHLPEHKEKWCPQRRLSCEYCNRGVKACEMNSHLNSCEIFPVKCPNGCSVSGAGKSGPRVMERRKVSVHLSTECPLQIVECPLSNKGCTQRMERKLTEEHKIYKCPKRDLICEYCQSVVKACEMSSHLKVCEMLPVECPNFCVESGNTSRTRVKRRDLSTHLSDECPLQIVKCRFLDHGCREEMKRNQLDSHEIDSIHSHFKLSIIEAEELRQMQVASNSKILTLEQENASKDLEIKQLKDLISNGSKTEWRIDGINGEITGNKISAQGLYKPSNYYGPRYPTSLCDSYSYSNPFYTGKYKCQCKIVWSHAALKGKIGCFISIVRGKFDAALRWPFVYQVKFKLHNQIMNGDDHIWSHRVSEEDMQRFPECFQRPTKVRNRAFGVASFFPRNELLTPKYCVGDAISISISVKQLAVL